MDRLSIAIAFVLILGASSLCREESDGELHCPGWGGSTIIGSKDCQFDVGAAKESAKTVGDLAVKLYEQISKPKENVVFSPVSIALALALLERGAAGTTRDRIQNLIGVKGENDSSNLYHALQRQLQIQWEKARLSIANGLFLSENLRPKPDFLGIVQKCFETKIAPELFKNQAEEARLRINRWVANRTAEKIPELFKPGSIDPATLAVLANAVYLKADWLHRLSEDGVQSFYQFGNENQAQTVRFMSIDRQNFNYHTTGDFQLVELPYDGVPLSMFIILPKKRDGIAALEKSLKGDQLLSMFGRNESRLVSLKIPKFTIRQSVDLQPVLAKLGLEKLFSSDANFSRMSMDEMKISKAVHEAFIKVSENGTEAGAATGFKFVPRMAIGHSPIPFVADHPFIFAIVHKPTSAIVFMGKVNSIDKQE